MLSREDSAEFFKTIAVLLEVAKKQLGYEESLARDDDAMAEDDKKDLNETPEAKRARFEMEERGLCSLLRGCLYAFMGNLCLDKSLRTKFCMDFGGILS